MIGKTISHYKILEKLGSGGMGDVYIAEDTKLKRTVALKFLPQNLTRDDEAKKRFLYEAQAASALDHKNIGSIYEIDETEDGQMFIAMAYYEGATLKGKIERGPLPLEDSIDIATQIAEGLAKAHTKEIVHRDIKPANIMTTEDGEVKIIDFGLAKLTGQSKLTMAGMTLGTVAYMSPQQTQGTSVDHRTDIWALGVVLYEMITGQLPFKGDYEQAVMYSIMQEDPEPFSSSGGDVPEALEIIVNRALQKDLSDRYQSANELLSDLRALKGGEASTTAVLRKTKPTSINKRNLAIWTGAVLLLASMLFVAIFFWPFSEKTNAHASIAVLPFVDMSREKDQEYFCDGMTEELLTKLSKLSDLKVIARTSVMRYKNTDKSIKEIGDALGVSTILEGSIRKEGDNIRVATKLINVEDETLIWSEDYNKKMTGIFELQSEVAGAIADVLQLKLTPSGIAEFKAAQPKNVEAYEYYLKGMYQLNRRYIISELERAVQNALDMFNKAIEIDSSYALAYVGRGRAYRYKCEVSGFQDEAVFALMKENYELALQLDPNSAEAHAGVGIVYAIKSDFDNAYQSLKKSMTLNPNVTEINFDAAMLLRSRGLFQHSMRCLAKAKELDPFWVATYTNLAQDLIHIGQYDEVPLLLEKAKELEPEFVPIHGMEAQLAIILKKYDEAEDIIAQADRIHPGRIALEKALLFAARGEKEKALAFSSHPWFFMVVGEVYALLGMKDEAIEEIIKATNQGRSHYYYLNLISNPLLRNLEGEPRFLKFVQEQKSKYKEYLQQYGDLVAG